VVLVGESAEDLLPADPVLCEVDRFGWPGAGLSRGELAEATVRPGGVVVLQVLGQHLAETVLIDDQQPVEKLTAQGADDPFADRVRVTHPFHPLCGQDFEFVVYRQNWGEDRVHLHDENGQLFSVPAAWTDAVAADPFVVIAAGRAPFTTAGLLALADLAGRLRAQRDGAEAVKQITP
jgi:hypothetical protein